MFNTEAAMQEICRIKAGHMDQLAAYRQNLYASPVLRLLFLELTLRCNENGFHCGRRCGSESMVVRPLDK